MTGSTLLFQSPAELRKRLIPLRPYLLPLAGLLATSFLAALLSGSPYQSLLKFLSLLAAALFMVLVACHTRSRADARYFLFLILQTGLATFMIGFLQDYYAAPPGSRFASIFAQSDVYGGFLLLIVPAAITLYLLADSRWDRFLFGAAASFLGSGIVLTFSRGAWLVAAITAILLGGIAARRNPGRTVRDGLWLLLSFGVILGAVQIIHLPDHSVIERARARAATIWNPGESSIHARFSFWGAAAKIALAHPFVGVGQGNYGKALPHYQTHYYFYSKFPHNWYLQVASETGLLALGSLLWLLTLLMIKGWRGLAVPHAAFPYRLALFTAVTAGLLHLGLDVESNFGTFTLLFFCELGLLAALASPAFEKHPDPLPSPVPFFPALRAGALMLLLFAGGAQATAYAGERLHEEALRAEEAGKLPAATLLAARAARLLPIASPVLEVESRLAFKAYRESRNPEILERAIAIQERAIRWDRLQPSLYLGLSHLAAALPDRNAAIAKSRQALERGLDLDPVNFPAFYTGLGDLALLAGRPAEARRYFVEVIRRYPPETFKYVVSFRRMDFLPYAALARVGMGKAAAAGRDYAAARRWFEGALSLAEHPEVEGEGKIAHFYLGQLDLREHLYRSGAEHFEKAVKHAAAEMVARQYLAFALWQSGELKRAREEIEKAAVAQPANPDVLLIRGDIARAEGRIAAARRDWIRALLYAPGDPTLTARLRSLPQR